MCKVNNEQIPIIIPAYEPDERLIGLLQSLIQADLTNIIIVNDGSGENYNYIFEESAKLLESFGGIILSHDENKGKGRALKTAFEYVLTYKPEAIGVVSADSDGQHSQQCIESVMDALANNKDALVIGARTFDGEEIPWKSRFGNKVTLSVLKFVSGLDVSDTQTGLRGIPRQFMEEVLIIPGERFEFETKMLLESVGKYPIKEVPIETIYDSKENHSTHFKPVADSVKIYRILFGQFAKYLLSSISSFIIDILLFSVFTYLLKNLDDNLYILYATIVARVISSLFNYFINYLLVFESKEKKISALVKYYLLAAVQMLVSGLLVTLFVKLFSLSGESLVKIIVDSILFLVSFKIQKLFVFKKH